LIGADKGDLFGWGNTEYNQLGGGHEMAEMQMCIPRHIPVGNAGKVIRAAAAGSSCAIVNGNRLVF